MRYIDEICFLQLVSAIGVVLFALAMGIDTRYKLGVLIFLLSATATAVYMWLFGVVMTRRQAEKTYLSAVLMTIALLSIGLMGLAGMLHEVGVVMELAFMYVVYLISMTTTKVTREGTA